MQLANHRSSENVDEASHVSSIAKENEEFDEEEDNEFNDEVKYEKHLDNASHSISNESKGSHSMSHQSLLATQRVRQNRIEKERHITQLAANEFAKDSARDSNVNSDRTLHMIMNRKKSVLPVKSKITLQNI